jgi:HAE1 family hydrophobic/amphiphilic exporter-1/multidrug efflux pump
MDSHTEKKKVSLVVTSPGFGSSSVNSSLKCLSLKEPRKKVVSRRNCDNLTKWTTNNIQCQTSVTQQPNNAISNTWRFTNTIHYTNSKLSKLEEKIPSLWTKWRNDPTFQLPDVTKVKMKFLSLTLLLIAKAESRISVIDIAQTLQPLLTTFCYFMKKETIPSN